MRDPGQKPWIRRSLKEKREHAIAKSHTRPAACIACGMGLMPDDMAAHRKRCAGRPEPDGLDRWETERESAARGVAVVTLRRLAEAGKLRTRNGGAEYLVRDVEQYIQATEFFPLTTSQSVETMSPIAKCVLLALDGGPLTLREIGFAVRRRGSVVKKAIQELSRLRLITGRQRKRERQRAMVYFRGSQLVTEKGSQEETNDRENSHSDLGVEGRNS